MPSLPDSLFLFVLALLLFGPKRLPALARELGKWVGEFRRASNEFKMQMEEEMRLSDQAEKNKQIAAMEAAAPVAPVMAAETGSVETEGSVEAQVSDAGPGAPMDEVVKTERRYEVVDGVRTVLPIAEAGEMKMMPPATGLPVAQSRGGADEAAETEATVHGN
jgi:sec-independent protein translocase protein TatB